MYLILRKYSDRDLKIEEKEILASCPVMVPIDPTKGYDPIDIDSI